MCQLISLGGQYYIVIHNAMNSKPHKVMHTHTHTHTHLFGATTRELMITHAYTQVLVLFIFTFVFAFLSLFIYVEFGWKTYVLVDCNPGMRCKETKQASLSLLHVPCVFSVDLSSLTSFLPRITLPHTYNIDLTMLTSSTPLHTPIHTCTQITTVYTRCS